MKRFNWDRYWSGHGLPRSTEDPETWESSWLRRLLRRGYLDKKNRNRVYGILMRRRYLTK